MNQRVTLFIIATWALRVLFPRAAAYSVPDTGQTFCTTVANSIWSIATCPSSTSALYGQDASYTINPPAFSGSLAATSTVQDLVTGLTWTNHLVPSKLNYAQAVASVSSVTTGGYTDWRLPTIKELFSLINYNGAIDSGTTSCATGCVPFLNTTAFEFKYGTDRGETRVIDSQFVSSTTYVSTVMGGQSCVFGVNLADGRIKCYPLTKNFEVLYVRGSPSVGSAAYGTNSLTDQGDQTVVDSFSGLQWMKMDSGNVSGAGAMNWPAALQYCESSSLAGYTDWRLPTPKEGQSISDYSRSPKTTNSPALPAVFSATPLKVEDGSWDWGWEWTSTTLYDGGVSWALYVTRGRALGYMNGAWMDVHGAGAVRSDPKTSDGTTYPFGHGPQGDAIRGTNFVRCVRSVSGTSGTSGTSDTSPSSPTVPTVPTVPTTPTTSPVCYFTVVPANSLTTAPYCGAFSSASTPFIGSCNVGCASGTLPTVTSPASISCTTTGPMAAPWSCVTQAAVQTSSSSSSNNGLLGLLALLALIPLLVVVLYFVVRHKAKATKPKKGDPYYPPFGTQLQAAN